MCIIDSVRGTQNNSTTESKERGKTMTRKRARHLLMELARRIYLEKHGTLRGFGKTASFYRDSWKPGEGINRFGGYKGAWENEIIREMRKSCGML